MSAGPDRGVGFHAGCILRRAGNDIDAAKKGIDAIGGGIRSPTHLNAFNVLQCHRHAQPVDVGQADSIGRSPVNLNLQPALLVLGGTVVGCNRIGASPVANHHAGNQPECLYEIHDAEVANHVSGDDRGGAGHPEF